MPATVLYTILALSAVGILSAVLLYFVSKKFHVREDPRITETEKALPGVNCGGCGYPSCRAFAEACVAAEDLSKLYCVIGRANTMAAVAQVLGRNICAYDPRVAVVRCNGSFDKRPKTNIYDSARSCAVAHCFYGGETGCIQGCLWFGDCVAACKFDAMFLDPKTGLPVVKEDKCTACGACVAACPRRIIELRKKGPEGGDPFPEGAGKRVYVCCINRDPGAVARKVCQVACIACGRCVRACPVNAITLENNLAYIDFNICNLCQKCVVVCPTTAIVETNFPVSAKEALNNSQT